MLKLIFQVTFIVVALSATVKAEERPCAARKYDHSSVVCVCNSTYCDDVSPVRQLPSGKYVLYTSSLEGLRFKKTVGKISKRKSKSQKLSTNNVWQWLGLFRNVEDIGDGSSTLEINRDKTYQEIVGFGGAFTDATGINVFKLSENTQEAFYNSYYSDRGIEYNLGRVPIGGTDFSTHPYAYNMEPIDDKELSNFTLSEEDFKYKIPMIGRARSLSTAKLALLASAWSPPVWMKTNGQFGGASRLKEEYYQTWADYHVKFVDEYLKNAVKIWAISTGNEPSNGIIPVMAFNSLGWMPSTQAKWVAENLGPAMSNAFPEVRILALDDQRFSLPWWIDAMAENKEAMKYIDGIGVHWYWDELVATSHIDSTHDKFPDKFLLATEACVGDKPWQTEKVQLGSWSRAEMYIKDILEDLNHWFVGWLDWNLALDEQGGPNWFQNYVDSPVIVRAAEDEILKQPMFYALGHFSKFLPRGSRRVYSQVVKGNLDHVAFLRPDGGIAVIFYNPINAEKTVIIREKEKGSITLKVPARSVHSLIYW